MGYEQKDKNLYELEKLIYELKKEELEKDIEYGNSKKILHWLGIYTKYLRYEKKFNPTKLIEYKKGNIILADFGYNVGNELGGVHFSVVLENYNSQKSGTITVVPLSSIKGNGVNNKYAVEIENGVYELLYNKNLQLKKMNEVILKAIEGVLIYLNKELNRGSLIKESKSRMLSEQLSKYLEEVIELNKGGEWINEMKKYSIQKRMTIEEVEQAIYVTEVQINKLRNNIECIDKLNGFILKAKSGTKALVSQITTISKLRIIDPKREYSPLAKVSMEDGDLIRIETKIKELFLK